MNNLFEAQLSGMAHDLNEKLFSSAVPIRALVTGGTGLIGQSLVKLLVELATMGQDIYLDLLVRSEARAKLLFGDGASDFITFHDITSTEAISEIKRKKYTHILHLASPATPKDFSERPLDVFEMNIDLTRTLLDIAEATGAIFLLASTMEIYGQLDPNADSSQVLISEEDFGRVAPTSPRSLYPLSKQLAENICVQYANSSGVTSILARLSHTYGPGYSKSDDRVQVQFFEAAKSKAKITLQSAGDLTRTYTYVLDAANALIFLMLRGGIKSTATPYNIADQDSLISIRDLALTVLDCASLDPSMLEINIPQSVNKMWSKTQTTLVLDTTRLRALGWCPQYTLQQGITASLSI